MRASVDQEAVIDRVIERAIIPFRTELPMTVAGKSQKFQIVGSAEANPGEHKLSNESPIGKDLVGSKKNEVVTVEKPRGTKKKMP